MVATRRKSSYGSSLRHYLHHHPLNLPSPPEVVPDHFFMRVIVFIQPLLFPSDLPLIMILSFCISNLFLLSNLNLPSLKENSLILYLHLILTLPAHASWPTLLTTWPALSFHFPLSQQSDFSPHDTLKVLLQQLLTVFLVAKPIGHFLDVSCLDPF